MLRNPLLLRYGFGLSPKSIVHVGAHEGQNRPDYEKLGAKSVYWFEALPDFAQRLKAKYPKDRVYQGVAWDAMEEEIEFHEMRLSENSSAVKPLPSSNHTPIVVHSLKTLTLDQALASESFDQEVMLVLDVQGAELRVIKGAENFLKKTTYVVCEIGVTNQGYESVPTESELESLLLKSGFRKSIRRISKNELYFDQLFLKKSYAFILKTKVVDICFDLILRVRHFLVRFHVQRHHYHCDKCGF